MLKSCVVVADASAVSRAAVEVSSTYGWFHRPPPAVRTMREASYMPPYCFSVIMNSGESSVGTTYPP